MPKIAISYDTMMMFTNYPVLRFYHVSFPLQIAFHPPESFGLCLVFHPFVLLLPLPFSHDKCRCRVCSAALFFSPPSLPSDSCFLLLCLFLFCSAALPNQAQPLSPILISSLSSLAPFIPLSDSNYDKPFLILKGNTLSPSPSSSIRECCSQFLISDGEFEGIDW